MVTAVNSNYRTHTVRKNETLWSIARNELGKDATNNQIANYTNKVAKLNKLNTEKKRNTIFVNDKLYLPEKSAVNSAQKSAVAKVNKTTAATVNKTTAAKTETNAEKGFKKLAGIVASKKLRIEKAYLSDFSSVDMYHVYYTDKLGHLKLACTYTKNKDGKSSQITFNGDKQINFFGYDYVITPDGNIYENKEYDLGTNKKLTIQGKIQKAGMQKIISAIEKQIPKK